MQFLECSGPSGHYLPCTWESDLVMKSQFGEDRSKWEFSSMIKKNSDKLFVFQLAVNFFSDQNIVVQ